MQNSLLLVAKRYLYIESLHIFAKLSSLETLRALQFPHFRVRFFSFIPYPRIMGIFWQQARNYDHLNYVLYTV